MSLRSRIRYVISAIKRFHGAAAIRYHEDVGQLAALACLTYEDNAGAVRMASRHFRRLIDYRRPTRVEITWHDLPWTPPPEHDREEFGALWSLVDRLHPRHREVLVRCEIDDVPRQYVADEMGLTETQVGTLIRSARIRLRKLCAVEGIRG